MDAQKTVLPSGLCVVSVEMPDRHSVSVGVWLRNGARDEPPEWLGISHLIEHMMFKGTERRDARAIARSLESLGGHLDAFTSREQVCYYARVLSEHLPQAVEVLADIVCHSQFAEAELAREKNVVGEEIRAAEDSPDDRVSEMLAAQVWGDHGLGRPILGTLATLEALTPKELRAYFRRRYRAESLVVAAAGGLDHQRLVDLVTRQFEPPADLPDPLSGAPPAYAPSARMETREDLQQLYLSLATRGLAFGDPARYPLAVLSALLGGGMSSRLFQSVREEAGLAYSIYSSAEFHRDTGTLAVHLGVAPDRGREALALVRRELEALTLEGAPDEEVRAAKAQLRGGLLMAQESVTSRMHHVAGEEIYLGRYSPPEEHVAQIEQVTKEQVAEAARSFLEPDAFCLAALGPRGGPEITASDWGNTV
jgi:predicted Zn-dependent peptidase